VVWVGEEEGGRKGREFEWEEEEKGRLGRRRGEE